MSCSRVFQTQVQATVKAQLLTDERLVGTSVCSDPCTRSTPGRAASETGNSVSDVICGSHVVDELCRRMQYRLKTMYQISQEADQIQNGVSAIRPRYRQSDHQRLEHFTLQQHPLMSFVACLHSAAAATVPLAAKCYTTVDRTARRSTSCQTP